MVIRYAPVRVNHGFDSSASPNWQMVPVGGTRVLAVSGVAGLVPRVRTLRAGTDPVTATLSGSGANIRLTLTGARAPGRCWVEWVPSAAFVGAVDTGNTLEISVKTEKVIRTAFHYVTDNRKQKTNRKIDDLDRMITAANAILTPQANVTLQRKSAAVLEIAQNLGDVVRYSRHLEGAPDNVDPAQHEWGVVTAGADATADFNVFFVRRYEQDNTPYVNDTRAGTIASEKNCLLEDNIDSPPETLAHETLHLLGIDPHSGNRTHLIASGAVRTGQVIDRDEANTINPSGT